MAKAAALLLLVGASASHAAVHFEEKFDSRKCRPLPRAAPARAVGIARVARRWGARNAAAHVAAVLHGGWRGACAPRRPRFDGLLQCTDLRPPRPPARRSGVGEEVGEEQLEEVGRHRRRLDLDGRQVVRRR